MKKWLISRRTFLHGFGAAIALPMLEAMIPTSAHAQSASRKRLSVMYFPSGMYGATHEGRSLGAWLPAHNAALSSAALPLLLEPLNNFKNDFSIVSWLDNPEAYLAGADTPGEGAHSRSCPTFLTCKQKRMSGIISIDPSMDQLIAQHLIKTQSAKLESLILSMNPNGNYDGNKLPHYLGHISYKLDQVVPKETRPSQVFSNLFSGFNNQQNSAAEIERQRLGKSILDAVKSDAASIKRKLGASDTLRLNEYLEGIRQIEVDLSTLPKPTTSICQVPQDPGSAFSQSYYDGPTYVQALNIMLDLQVAALRCGLTNVSTLMLDTEGWDRDMSLIIPSSQWYNGVKPGEYSHNVNAHWSATTDPVERERRKNALIGINRFQVSFFAGLISRMKAVQEPDGTMLDNSVLIYGCPINDGAGHHRNDVPLLVAGGKNLGFKPGYHHNCQGSDLAQLYLTVMQRMGMSNTQFAGKSGILSNV